MTEDAISFSRLMSRSANVMCYDVEEEGKPTDTHVMFNFHLKSGSPLSMRFSTVTHPGLEFTDMIDIIMKEKARYDEIATMETVFENGTHVLKKKKDLLK